MPEGVTVLRHVVAITRLSWPRLPHRYLSRQRLLNRIVEAGEGTVTLLSAPQGHGKTALLAEFAALGKRPLVWLTITGGAGDAPLPRLITAAVAACPILSGHIMSLQSSEEGDFVAKLVNALDNVPQPVDMVLDGFDAVADPAEQEMLVRLVRDWPARPRLFMTSRRTHPLPLGRLRLQGHVGEIRRSDLAFSAEDIGGLLALGGLDASPELLADMQALTEGWIAPLQLALSCLSSGLTEEALRSFLDGGDHLSDYLDEMLAPLPSGTLNVLNAISICDKPSVSLAATLTGELEIGPLLNAIARKNPIISCSTGAQPTFAMAPLVQRHIASNLERMRPHRFRALHLQAATWFCENGELAQALLHVTRSGDVEAAAEFLNLNASSLLMAGHYRVVRQAFELLSAKQISANALLCLAMAMACLETGELELADTFIEKAHGLWPGKADPELMGFRAAVRSRRAWLAGEYRQADGNSATAGDGMSWEVAIALATELSDSQVPGAPTYFSRSAAVRGKGQTNQYFRARSLVYGGLAAAAEGDLGRMVRFADKADAIIQANSWVASELEAYVTLMHMLGTVLQGDPAACADIAARAQKGGSAINVPLLKPPIQTCLGIALFDLGERSKGLDLMRSIRLALPDNFIMHKMIAFSASFECQAAISLGRIDDAHQTLAWAEQRMKGSGEILLMRAALTAHQGRYVAASRILRPVLDGTHSGHLAWTRGEAWLLECEMALQAGNRRNACVALGQALTIFRETSVTRPLTYASPGTIQLLTEQIGSLDCNNSFAREWLANHKHPAEELPPALTDREWTVLRALPTHMALNEIADSLSVSVNTVKTHVKSIYAKLDAGTRRGAVARAYKLGLLICDHADGKGQA